MENVLDAIRNGEMPVTSDWLDVLFEALDHRCAHAFQRMGSSEDVMHNLKVCRIFFQQQQLFMWKISRHPSPDV
jgi:chemotaxis protein histidine kinase CheA